MNLCRRSTSWCQRVSLSAFAVCILLTCTTASAESGPLLDAGGCFGDLPASDCETNADCDGESSCYRGQCDCSIGFCEESPTRRERCTSDGCFCEDRPACITHSQCAGVLCVFGQCTAGIPECESLSIAHEVCDPPGSCRCERRPTCEYHDDCEGVLCHSSQCFGGQTECPMDARFHEFCDEVGCRCDARDGCRWHNECEGDALCVLNYCNDTVSACTESEEAPHEVCGGGGCVCRDRIPDAGPGATPDGGSSADAGPFDAGPDGGAAASSSGCSASSTGTESVWLLVVLGWALRRRR